MKTYKNGTLRIAPKTKAVEPFEITGDYCTQEFGGELYFYTGRTPQTASSSFPGSIVTVLEETYEYHDFLNENNCKQGLSEDDAQKIVIDAIYSGKKAEANPNKTEIWITDGEDVVARVTKKIDRTPHGTVEKL